MHKITMWPSISGILEDYRMGGKHKSLHPWWYFGRQDATKTINSHLSLAGCRNTELHPRIPVYMLKLFTQSKPKLLLALTEITFSNTAFTKISLGNLVQKISTSIKPIFKGLNDFLNLPESVIQWIIYFVDGFIRLTFLVLVTLKKVASD